MTGFQWLKAPNRIDNSHVAKSKIGMMSNKEIRKLSPVPANMNTTHKLPNPTPKPISAITIPMTIIAKTINISFFSIIQFLLFCM